MSKFVRNQSHPNQEKAMIDLKKLLETDLKAKLLEHYAMREPKPFLQFDGWHRSADPFTGGGLTIKQTYELMRMHQDGPRVLLPQDVPQAEAVIMLRRILDWIENCPPPDFAKWREFKGCHHAWPRVALCMSCSEMSVGNGDAAQQQ
jgi:hypothetical protein